MSENETLAAKQDMPISNRWLVVGGAILIQLCLGAIYAWSAFTAKITAADGIYQFSASQAAWVFSAGLGVFAILLLFAGKLLATLGPRKLTAISAIVFGGGYVLGGFFGGTFLGQLICIGIIGGAGIGLGYVVPIKVGIAWFPDKKGLISGLAVAGFGFGAVLWVKLAGSWFGGLLNTADGMMGLPGVQAVFVIYGIIFTVFVLLGSLVMVNPPEGYKPEGWTPPPPSAKAATGAVDLTRGEMIRTPQYWGLLAMYTGSALAGLMVIYCIKLFGIDALQTSGAAANATIAGAMAGTAMAWYSILNGLGRIVWGVASDKIGRKMALTAMCVLQGVIMLLFFKMGHSVLGLTVGACIIGFNFGGNFALFPSATADFFGNKNVGTNYGLVFIAYGVAGIAGPQVAGFFKDAAKGGDVSAWTTPFLIAGIACLVAAAIGLMLKPPKHAHIEA